MLQYILGFNAWEKFRPSGPTPRKSAISKIMYAL